MTVGAVREAPEAFDAPPWPLAARTPREALAAALRALRAARANHARVEAAGAVAMRQHVPDAAKASLEEAIQARLQETARSLRLAEEQAMGAAVAVMTDELGPSLIEQAEVAWQSFAKASRGLHRLAAMGWPAPDSPIARELRHPWHHTPEVWAASGPDLDGVLAALLADATSRPITCFGDVNYCAGHGVFPSEDQGQ